MNHNLVHVLFTHLERPHTGQVEIYGNRIVVRPPNLSCSPAYAGLYEPELARPSQYSALSASSLSTPSTPSDGHGPAQTASRAFGVEQAAVRTLLAVAISVQRSFEAGALVPYYSDMPTLGVGSRTGYVL